MNRKDKLLELFDGVEDCYIAEAMESRQGSKVAPRLRFLPLAALIAAAALMLGCAAGFFWMPELTIGTGSHPQPDSTTEAEHQVVSFAGLSETPTSQALRQWREFREGYDPEGNFSTNEPDQRDIPNNYEWVYHCYTQEMTQKLDEIAAQYDLKLLDTWIPVDKLQSSKTLEALGVSSMLTDGANANMGAVRGMLYPPYNYELHFALTLTGADAAWQEPVEVSAYYCRKDYLPEDAIVWELMLEDFDQWCYTTTKGIEVMLARNQYGLGFLHVEQEDAFLTVVVFGNTAGIENPKCDQLPGKKAMEQIAEALDLAITPKVIRREILLADGES